jgi:hypothetical protein
MSKTTATAVITSRSELEQFLDKQDNGKDRPGLPFAVLLYRTTLVSGNGLLVNGRKSKVKSAELYPDGIRHICSKPIRARRSYAQDVINERVSEAAQGIGPFADKTEAEIRAMGYQTEGLHRGYTASVGFYLGQHKTRGSVYFVYSLDQRRGSPAIREANWERWVNIATGEDLTDAEVESLKAEYLKKDGKTGKQGCKFDRKRRTIHIGNVLSITCGENVLVDGENFRIDQ